MAMSQPYTGWISDPYAPRDPVHQPHDQSRQSVRLPPPGSLVAPRENPSLAPNPPSQHYVYQNANAYAPASSTQISRPPPAGPSLHQNASTVTAAGQQQRLRPDMNQAPPTYPYPSPARSHDAQEDQVPSFASERAMPGPQPPPFRYEQRPQGGDAPIAPPRTPQQQYPTAASSARQPSISESSRSAPEARPDPMRISDIVTSSRQAGGTDIEYKLKIRQQPMAARSCGFGERDRRVVDPPPIVQLLIQGPNLTAEELSLRLRYGHYVMSCTIYDESGTRDASFMPEEYRQQRRLMGSLVGAPFVGKDEFDEEGCFFCFPDLSCRTPGGFRLKFSLVMIDPLRAKEVKHFPVLIEAMSEVFTVYNAKDFPGMQASTRLTKRLKEQGCIISIKKGNDKTKNSRALLDDSDGDLDDDEESAQAKRKRRLNRG